MRTRIWNLWLPGLLLMTQLTDWIVLSYIRYTIDCDGLTQESSSGAGEDGGDVGDNDDAIDDGGALRGSFTPTKMYKAAMMFDTQLTANTNTKLVLK